MAKTVLITGANGQLGNEMRLVLDGNDAFSPIFTDVQELDITSKDAIDAFFANHHIDYVVNCAAYTAVDNAEDNVELCTRLNADAVEYLAQAAKHHDAKMVQISTDYVFNGTNFRPYREDDETSPCSVYGSTKLDGQFGQNERNIVGDLRPSGHSYLCQGFGCGYYECAYSGAVAFGGVSF